MIFRTWILSSFFICWSWSGINMQMLLCDSVKFIKASTFGWFKVPQHMAVQGLFHQLLAEEANTLLPSVCLSTPDICILSAHITDPKSCADRAWRQKRRPALKTAADGRFGLAEHWPIRQSRPPCFTVKEAYLLTGVLEGQWGGGVESAG